MKGDLIGLRANGRIKIEFDKIKLKKSWCAQLGSFLQMSKTVLEIFVPFTTAYVEECIIISRSHQRKRQQRLE
jgi:hypothetical protein